MDEGIRKILEDHEARLQRIEAALPKGKAPRQIQTGLLALFQKLREDGFFSQEKTDKEILDKLAEKGRIYKRVESLTDSLQRATQQEILKRKKNAKGKWVYYA